MGQAIVGWSSGHFYPKERSDHEGMDPSTNTGPDPSGIGTGYAGDWPSTKWVDLLLKP